MASSTIAELMQTVCDDTRFHSNPRAWMLHPAYLEVKAMGAEAVPALVALCQDEASAHWPVFDCLREITGELPPKKSWGRYHEVRKFWAKYTPKPSPHPPEPA